MQGKRHHPTFYQKTKEWECHKSILNNIFDISKPTSREGTQSETGTGYGMPIVKKWVEMFRGKLTIESFEKPHPLQGTEVSLHLKES
ncbi:MAG: sensor histidine kinase [Leptospiraceae bacterium]|nr:sensor histidine kinase [Leptospiraceae bacterium]